MCVYNIYVCRVEQEFGINGVDGCGDDQIINNQNNSLHSDLDNNLHNCLSTSPHNDTR